MPKFEMILFGYMPVTKTIDAENLGAAFQYFKQHAISSNADCGPWGRFSKVKSK